MTALDRILKLFRIPILGIQVGGGTTRQSDRFRRRGATISTQSRNHPEFLEQLIQTAAKGSEVSPLLASEQDRFILDVLRRDSNDMPEAERARQAIRIEPGAFPGRHALVKITERDPTSNEFEVSTRLRYEKAALEVLAFLASGPDAVRGGDNRVAMRQGETMERLARGRADEIRKARQEETNNIVAAASALNAIENARRTLVLTGQQGLAQQFVAAEAQRVQTSGSLDNRRGINATTLGIYSNLVGEAETKTVEDLAGEGNQSGGQVGWGMGLNCCFVFLEAFDGRLPEVVRQGRDKFFTPQRRDGYVLMSVFLVPLMRYSPWIRRLVKLLLIRPFVSYGHFHFGKGRWWGAFFKPYCHAWFKAWDYIGGIYGAYRSTTSR